MQDSDNEDEVRNDERDIRGKNFETTGDTGAVSDGYSTIGEEHVPKDDDRVESMENEKVD